MSINGEPIEGENKNYFEIPSGFRDAVKHLGDSEIKNQFLAIVAEKGLCEEALKVSPKYIQGIQQEFEEAAERAVGDDLKQALHLQQRILPQIALAVMLHEVGEDEEADAVLDDVYTMLIQKIDSVGGEYTKYFQSLIDLLNG